MKILLFTRSLNAGGAERQLTLLAKQLHARGMPVAVMVFYSDGPFREELEQAGVKLIDLNKTGRWDIFGFFFRTIAEVRKYKPDIIYNFIGSHLVSTWLKPFFSGAKVVWGVRASNMDLNQYDWLSRISDRLSILFSRFADAIICNSNAGKNHILSQGYINHHIRVVGNGIDTVRFNFDVNKRLELRGLWGIGETEILIGIVARLDPMKDHRNFLYAAKQLLRSQSNVRFVCVGSGDAAFGQSLKDFAQQLGMADNCIWAGHHSDLSAVFSALDISSSSSSYGEGFPNTIAEAMACGLPVVATDVGDCRAIVGDCGWIVPPKTPEALVEAMLKSITALPNWQPERSRLRIVENYSVDAMVEKTLAILEATVKS